MNDFEKLIEEGVIKWLPWVGDNFRNGKHKILVVGESHYYNPDEEGSFEKHQRATFTQEVVDEMARQRDYYNTKIFQNFHLALMGNDAFAADNFWQQIAYFNFIQRPMNSNKERPQYSDFLKSWDGFEEVLKILKPTQVIFIGSSAAGAFNEFAISTQKAHDKVRWVEKIGSAYAKECSITLKDRIPILFIRHTSQYFSWPKWNKFLRSHLDSELSWLDEVVAK